MHIVLAGATGAIGVPLSVALLRAGHRVTGITRTAAGATALQARGVSPLIADVMQRDGLLRAADAVRADAVIHELTALKKPPAKHAMMRATNDLRIRGSAHLVELAGQVGATRYLTQSIVFGYGYRDHGPDLLTEDRPFGQLAGDRTDEHVLAMAEAERYALHTPGLEGMALRYGLFYELSALRPGLLKRAIPVAAGRRARRNRLSWVHLDDAVAATVAALEHGRPGRAYNIVDDHPASWREVITEAARAVRAPRPVRLPAPVVRLAAPYAATMMLDVVLGASNARAVEELGWQPTFPSYREGIST